MNNILSKRAYTIIGIIFAMFFIISLFAGCGDDDPITNNNGTGETIAYSIDSIVLRSFTIGSTDSIFNSSFIADLDSVRIQFSVETNVPNMLTSLSISVEDSTAGLCSFNLSEGQLNESYVQLAQSPFALCTKQIQAHLTVNGNGGMDKYLIVRNFKIFKIN